MTWTYKLSDYQNGYIISDERNGNLANVYMTNDPKIAESRARLMTAAPRILEALVASAEVVCSLSCESVKTTDRPWHHSPLCVEVHAAIKAAIKAAGLSA